MAILARCQSMLPPLIYIPVICALLACCSSAALPTEALVGVEARAARKLRTQEIGEWIEGADKSLALVVLDAKVQGGGTERRAYLEDKSGKTRYLGALQRQLPGAPVESLFFDANGSHFAVIWVDSSVAGQVDTVTIGRPIQREGDDSMNILRTGAVANRVAIIPMAPGEAALWNQLSDLLIYTGGTDFAWKHTYNPPLPIQSLYQKAALP